jgi:hypothetical protein
VRRQKPGGPSSWRLRIVFVLLGLSVLLGILHITLFGDPKTLGFYLALDVVFVPIQVLLVSIVIERFLSEREREAVLHKLNMVIGAFFGDVGNQLLGRVFKLCETSDTLSAGLTISARWKAADYAAAARFAEGYPYSFQKDLDELAALKAFLLAKRSFVLGLLQNPNLLEHNEFTDMIWAVCHLSEELEARQDLMALPNSDVEHLLGDVRRAFLLLIREWLAYMEHLQFAYPYMYSLSVRTNPFRTDASPLVVS